MKQTIAEVVKNLQGVSANWLIGGSCGLLLQGVQIGKEPRDLDMYADSDDAAAIAMQLSPWSVDSPQYSETEIYRSVLSHYRFNQMTVELVGGFQIISKGSIYTVETAYLRRSHAVMIEVGEVLVPLMPLAHELIFNLLRGREDRYGAIAAVMRADPDNHWPTLNSLLRRNTLSKELLRRMEDLLAVDAPATRGINRHES
ncbi:nucleotidyltransferase domain-containing protein [Paenibacillus hamazuiensis]|uniref:nucleotidyltransferase domain-containing protein n=1 Tax=Paenibacillus hamazuiensis TaxID=2936508 RepID=UPI00200FBA73|nr:hypothetical protein [Paenibacillus hamazuiensis]